MSLHSTVLKYQIKAYLPNLRLIKKTFMYLGLRGLGYIAIYSRRIHKLQEIRRLYKDGARISSQLGCKLHYSP